MVEEVVIDNTNDKAIVKSFDYADGMPISARALNAGGIKNIVKDIFKLSDTDTNIQKRIDELCKRKILVGSPPCELKERSGKLALSAKENESDAERQKSTTRKAKKRTYKLNNEIRLKFVCGPLPSEIESEKIPTEVRRLHTAELKKVIDAWIDFSPEPKTGNPYKEANAHKKGIEFCENFLLFPDLKNHLPILNYCVCSKWEEYKENLEKLEKKKRELMYSIENEINGCFCGLELRFIPDLENDIHDYECNLIQLATYILVLDLGGRIAGEDAWDNYRSNLNDIKHNTKFVENESIQWAAKMEGGIIQVPKEEKDRLVRGIDNLYRFIEDIPDSG